MKMLNSYTTMNTREMGADLVKKALGYKMAW